MNSPRITPAKRLVPVGMVIVGLLTGGHLAYAQFSGNASTVADGDWNDPATWGVTKPDTSVGVNIWREVTLNTDSTANRSGNAPHSGTFYIGDPGTSATRGAGYLLIGAGGKFTGTGATRIARDFTPFNSTMTGDGFLHLVGGVFNGGGVTVGPGTANTFTGRVRVESGGTYSAPGSNILGAAGTTAGQTGYFEVVGSGNTISMGSLLQRNGAVRFYFDATGISTIYVTGLADLSDVNAAILIDGTAYAGGPGSWTLISAGPDTVYGDIISRTMITGFDPSLTAGLAFDGNDLVFTLSGESPSAGVAVIIAVVGGTDIELSFAGENGLTYQLEKSQGDLNSWVPVGIPVDGIDGLQTLTDIGGVPAAGERVFYRVLVAD